MANAVYDLITERILTQLDNGVVPWRRPWGLQPGLMSNPRRLHTLSPSRSFPKILMHPQELLIGRESAVEAQGPRLEPARTEPRLQAATR